MHLAAAGVRARWDDAGRAGTAGGRPVFSIAPSIRSLRRVPQCHALEASARSFKKRYLKFQCLWLWRVCQLVTTLPCSVVVGQHLEPMGGATLANERSQ